MQIDQLIEASKNLTQKLEEFSYSVTPNNIDAIASPTAISITIFLLSCLIGYLVVWNVTPALHSPLMAVTNAISSVVIVGAIIVGGNLFSVFLASINIVGGFYITHRMLLMFKKK